MHVSRRLYNNCYLLISAYGNDVEGHWSSLNLLLWWVKRPWIDYHVGVKYGHISIFSVQLIGYNLVITGHVTLYI